ncbi:trehalose-phosphatase [Aquihabitans sp. McL0605]|uniref:trehalose-phosphatase n=1 Tax=Aquihabitans sp. McL0605 TaxID=3415671 RepID=UPI003CF59F2F
MPLDLASVVAPLRADPAATVLLFDFDGTLSPVVDDPAAATALPGVTELLEELAGSYRLVGAVSGRPVAFLAGVLPSSVALSGLYGLERRVGGEVVGHPEAPRWRPVVAEAVREIEAATAPGTELHGIGVEPKGLSITLHVRTRPELQDGAELLARQVGGRLALDIRPAKMSVELHPPIPADKGSALRDLAGDATGVLFAGDDVGDLPAFAALDHLGLGERGVSVAIDGPELPDDVRRRVQLVLPDQLAIVRLLEALRP